MIAPANWITISKQHGKHGWKTLFLAWDTKCYHHGLLQAGNNLKYSGRFLSTVRKFCKKLSVTLNFILSGVLIYFSTWVYPRSQTPRDLLSCASNNIVPCPPAVLLQSKILIFSLDSLVFIHLNL